MASSIVKVYGPVRAACPQRVMACLFELQQDFQVIHVDLDSGEHKSPTFLTRQPFGQVPAIEDGDFILYESRAIIRYLALKHVDRSPKLLGTTLEERALVEQWLEIEAHNFNDLVYTIVLQLVVIPKAKNNRDHHHHQKKKKNNNNNNKQLIDNGLVDSCKNKLDKVMDVYETRLSNTKYLAGDNFTLADLSHLPALRYLVHDAGMDHLVRQRENVSAWWDDISSRPAWKKVLNLAGF